VVTGHERRRNQMIKLSKFANDLTGWRVGKLVAEYPVKRTRSSLNVVWFCRCDCGGSVERVGSLLWQSDWGLQHCGCERALPPSTVTATASEQEKAYFAGYTDAEGCISIAAFTRNAAHYWFAFIYFGQTQPMVVERMHAIYGGSVRVEKRDQRRRRQKQLRLQRLSDVRRFLSDVTPQLREKRAQAEIVLKQFDPRADHGTNQDLSDRLVQLKATRLESVTIEPCLAIAPQAHRKCFDCAARSFSRGFCAKHYQKAKREGRIATNLKGAGVPFTHRRPLKFFDASYFAGYFDGDGCVLLRREGERWYPCVSFSQTQPQTLMEMHSIYGGSLTVGKSQDERRRPKLYYQLVQREAVLAMLQDIRPFVVEKRDQVELLLALYRPNMRFADGQLLKGKLSEMKQRTFNETSDRTVTVRL
jgi:hypothetical protein